MRRSRLVFSAVVVGALAPDLEYFVRLSSGGGWGHTLSGALCLSLPLGLAVLWLFHRFARLPIVALLPQKIQTRLGPYLLPFRFRGRLLVILASMLAGIATHLVWDSFTHEHTWLYHHWPFLRQHIHLPLVGSIRAFFLFQLVSSVGGIFVLLVAFAGWYRATPPAPNSLRPFYTPAQKAVIVAVMLLLSTAAAVVRAVLHGPIPSYRSGQAEYVGQIAITLTALLWWQLVGWGVILRLRSRGAARRQQTISR